MYKKLQDLNLKEVASKTQIELSFLEALQNKDFESLSQFNVRGFIKILSREYELDFSEFIQEFEAYLSENSQDSQKKIIIPKLDSYTQKSSNPLVFIIVFVILILIFCGIYFFDNIKGFFKSEENTTSTTVVDIIGQAEQNLQNLESQVIIIDNNEAKKSEENLSQSEELKPLNSNEEQNLSDENLSFENNLNEDLQSNEPLKEAKFKTNAKIWIGIIDLKTFKKTSLVKENDFNISLESDKLVLTGAGALSVFDENDKEQNFTAGNSKRFLIKDGKITSISLNEFMKLNKGKEW